MSQLLSLALIPLVLFLLAACRQDYRERSVRRWLILLWLAVLMLGDWIGAWTVAWWGALYGYGVLWLAGLPRGDRWGGAMVGAVFGWFTALPLVLAFALAYADMRRAKAPPHHLPFYPFLFAGVGGTILATLLVNLVVTIGG